MNFDGLEFIPLKEEHITELTAVMKRSFDDDSKLYFHKPTGGPEGYDDGSFLRKWGLAPGASAFCILLDKRPIGGIILFIDEGNKRGYLGNLFIDSGLIGKSYGHTAWRFAEWRYPQITLWETDTPAVSYRNHCFYINKCGFHVVAVEGGRDRFHGQFKLRKQIQLP